MTRVWWSGGVALSLLVPFAGAPALAAVAPPAKYAVYDVGALGGRSSEVTTVVRGDGVVYAAGYVDDGASRAAVWTVTLATGRVTGQDLGALPGDASSRAFGVTAAGVVAGNSTPADGISLRVVLWHPGAVGCSVTSTTGVCMTVLGPGEGTAIDRDGDLVVGRVDFSAGRPGRAATWTSSQVDGWVMTPLPLPDATVSSGALSVAPAGAVVGGSAHLADFWPGVVWTESGLARRLVPPRSGYPVAAGYVVGINDAGLATGYVRYSSPSSGYSLPVVWSPGPGDVTATPLPVPTDRKGYPYVGYAYSVNSAGTVVGVTNFAAARWAAGSYSYTDLNTTLGKASTVTLKRANSVDDVGDIGGLANFRVQTHGFVLVPRTS